MPTTPIATSDLLTQDEVATFLRVNRRSLERWRMTGAGPPFVKVGRKVGYRMRDVEAWLENQRRTHTRGSAA